MRALGGRIPRAYRDHRRRKPRAYAIAVRAMQTKHPGLGPEARPTLREYGVVVAELEQMHHESQSDRLSRRDRARLRRQSVILRSQLLLLERRLEELSQRNGQGHDLAARFAEHHREAGRA